MTAIKNINKDAPRALTDDPSFLLGIVTNALQAILEAQADEFCRAGKWERTEEREHVRNGYKPRVLRTRVGRAGLSVPQTRDGSFSTDLFERFQRSERAVELGIIEACVQGVATRRIAEIGEALCGDRVSRSTVSRLCAGLDAEVSEFRNRDLSGAGPWKYLFVDATYERVRVAGSVQSEGVLVATGVNREGRREVVGLSLGDTESEETYSGLFRNLRERGLSGVELVVSDAHLGLRAAIDRYFEGASWQRCQVHFLRDQLGKIGPGRRKELASDISAVLAQPTKALALSLSREFSRKWAPINESVATALDEEIEDCLAVYRFPSPHRKRIRTNNTSERLNEEIKRRSRPMRSFTNRESLVRIVGAVVEEISERWAAGNRWLDFKAENPPASDYADPMPAKLDEEPSGWREAA
jgi:transposase-like protein